MVGVHCPKINSSWEGGERRGKKRRKRGEKEEKKEER